MGDWGFIEQGELLACGLRQRLLPQGDHLTRTCSFWAPTWQQQAGWAPEVA